jgi:lysozyme
MHAPQVLKAMPVTAHFEGFRAKPYICPAGYPTVGYGHRAPSLDSPSVTREEAKRLLLDDLEDSWSSALVHCPALATSGVHRGAAIVDFVFNFGSEKLRTSTLRKAVNAEDWAWAARENRRWIHAKDEETGKMVVLPGLVRRRAYTSLWLEHATY